MDAVRDAADAGVEYSEALVDDNEGDEGSGEYMDEDDEYYAAIKQAKGTFMRGPCPGSVAQVMC